MKINSETESQIMYVLNLVFFFVWVLFTAYAIVMINPEHANMFRTYVCISILGWIFYKFNEFMLFNYVRLIEAPNKLQRNIRIRKLVYGVSFIILVIAVYIRYVF